MLKQFAISVILIFVLATGLLGHQGVFAQTSNADLRLQLEKELAELEKQISEYDQNIDATAAEKKTLQTEISRLKKEIDRLSLEVRRTGVLIRSVGDQIATKEQDIAAAETRIDQMRLRLTELLRRIWHEEKRSIWDILLTDDNLNDFANNLTALLILQDRNNLLLNEIRAAKTALEAEREDLNERQDELNQTAKIQSLQRQQQEAKRRERDQLLDLTDAQYLQLQTERQQVASRANEIRARIFELVGVTNAPTFGEAAVMAKQVSQLTGVRAAFVLAVLTQESNLGKNVGQCYLRNPETGEGVGANTGTAYVGVMAPGPPGHPKRNDVAVFIQITQALGRDPYNTRISCPINSPERGLIAGKNSWGGAMGPAQFIPTTWRGYEAQVRALTGSADPWNIRDAFTAAAVKLKKDGASSQTRDAEWRAALIYFSGSANAKYRFYGDSVLAIADRYEDDLKALESGS